MADCKSLKILKMRVDMSSYDDASRRIMEWSKNGLGRYVCVSNVHMCMEAFDKPDFCEIVNNADLVVADGKPLVWVQKIMGEKQASQVRGSDLFLRLCYEAESTETPLGLYGGTEDSLAELLKFLRTSFPELRITFASSPPFRHLTEKEDKKNIEEINNSAARILFVGIGCPKQEKWMAKHQPYLNCVMIGVGAAFDFFSGQKKHAPIWVQKLGLEWLFRLFLEPRRLWKRYLLNNPRFIYYLLKQLKS
jgi:N-acetylglucosaminyldiphosphoundecaprenol N-acetyl-beta-D-mannosaminyltransferase